ncbi:MAG: endonuclease Q family protein [Candidatus Micrarchaeia archaeon]
MLYYCDLHLHSKYSRAVSPDMDLPHLARGARLKGLGVLGTGDFTHPLWLKHLQEELVESEFEGFYRWKGDERTLFMLTAEVAVFHPGGGKRTHHVIHASSFDEVAALNEYYSKKGNLAADGRPMFAKTSNEELVEETLSRAPKARIVPAHVWTPWFGLFGDKSGYDSMREAFGPFAEKITALETGMSSDPEMNWRVSGLDGWALMSNSDSHSPTPLRLGRECNAFEFPEDALSFEKLFKAVEAQDASKFVFTIETNPAYGKYHYDGHRDCKFSCAPAESRRLGEKCPKCGKPLTIGVESRVEELADRPAGFKRPGAVAFKHLLPFQEIFAAVEGGTAFSAKAQRMQELLATKFGNEFKVLLEVPEKELAEICGAPLANSIIASREGRVHVAPGFDGEYGRLELPEGRRAGQKGLAEF